jgi:4-hydroxybenzoate polyprenyltransferase
MTAAALPRRLWTYQAERFPVFKHGLLILVFSGGEVLYGAQLRGDGLPWPALGVAALVCFGLFLQLRIADEHKDFEDDLRFRPERPVQRGLIRLAELRMLATATAVVQAAATALFHPPLLLLLLAVWGWMALMTAEFFVPDWLKARSALYLLSHMLAMPLIALFAVACGARGLSLSIGWGLAAFLALAFLNGVVLEVARKTWAPADERPGVETYSRLWGPQRAAQLVAGAATASALVAVLALNWVDGPAWAFGPVALGWAFLVFAALRFIRVQVTGAAKRLEIAAGVFALCVYLGVAWLPILIAPWTR